MATDGPHHLANRLLPLKTAVVVTAEPTSPQHWSTSRGVVIALVLLGFGLRIIPMCQDRDLWIDEAMLGLNLVERSPRQLLEPLDWNQGAPVGFLLAVKATMSGFGSSERAMRLFPLIGSLIGLIGFAWLARRMLPPTAATLALLLYAIAPHLISYSAECKQYATDAALTVAIFAAGIGLLLGEGGFRRWATLAVVGALAVWFSHPAAFVLGGVGGALFLDAIARTDRRRTGACLATIGCWLTSFGACYLLFLQQLGNNQYLLDYWAGHFLPLPPKQLGDIAWLADHYFGPIGYPGGLGGSEIKAGGIAAVFFLVGVTSYWRERWPIALALVVPGLLALLASGLHKYPFAGRLLLFLVPVLILGVARGAWVLGTALRQTQPFATVALIGVVVAAPALETFQLARRPLRQEQLTDVLAEVRHRVRPDDSLYVYYGTVPAWSFYTRDYPVSGEVTLGVEHRHDVSRYRDELRKFSGKPRVWLVFSHRHEEEERCIRSFADCFGDCLETINREGASAYLYDFTPR